MRNWFARCALFIRVPATSPLVAIALLASACGGDDGASVPVDAVVPSGDARAGAPARDSTPSPGVSASGGTGASTGGSTSSDPFRAPGGMSGDPKQPGSPGTSPGSSQAPVVVPAGKFADCSTPGPRLIRRLTARQYDNTIKSLLGRGAPSEIVLTDPVVLGFHVDADAALVSDLTAELLMNYAETVAGWAIENQLHQLTPCTNHDPGCHRRFIESFGRRAFRSPLSNEQVEPYLKLFAAEPVFESGLHVVLSTMLQSPYLLYRRELGEKDQGSPGEYQLTQYEVATQLAYLLTNSPPDQQMLDSAKNNQLQTTEQLDQQIFRLMFQESGREALTDFVHGWLEVDGLHQKAKDENVFNLGAELRQAMLDETREFFLGTIQQGGTIDDLFKADYTYVNGPLSEFYGIGGVSGDKFQRVSLDGSQRPSGVLGHASFLTQHAQPAVPSPVQRGVAVRERLLCQPLPPVPPDIDTNLDTTVSFGSNRERYGQHSSDPACAGCHSVIDPVGFAFENYDAFGRYQETENGAPIDASGELTGAGSDAIPLDGLDSLNDHLSESEAARSCFIRYWTYYAYGRDSWTNKECNHDRVREQASKNGYRLQDTLFAIIHAPHFRRRVAD